MARPQLVYTASNPDGRSIYIRFNPDWQEYVVQFFEDYEYLNSADYFTPCWDDAHETALTYLNKEIA